jgi:CO dehydrogenase/acetyl-CoA synthase delta subunit
MQTVQILKFVKKEVPPYVSGTISTIAGSVFRISSDWSRADYWGMIKCRVGAFRMNYAVSPGLYAVGEPTIGSDVFVSANYKLSFDILRRELKGLNAWVLVLDTKSINVWCAAGKGTFSTNELISRMSATKLDLVVAHRRIIVPQLGAVGVNGAEVQKKTGFRVYFGPVKAKDIPSYVEAGYKKTREMSTIRFPMMDRIILTPMEINPAMKKFPWFAGGMLILFGLEPSGILFKNAWSGGMPFLALGLITVFAGAFLTPVLLPFVPSRSFAIKGWIIGLLSMAAIEPHFGPAVRGEILLLVASWLFFPAMSSYIALQFTGSTTFTGMSGVKKELKIGIPLYLSAAGISLVLLVIYKIREWGFL